MPSTEETLLRRDSGIPTRCGGQSEIAFDLGVDREDQRVLVGVMHVYRAGGHACTTGNRAHGGAVQASIGDELQQRLPYGGGPIDAAGRVQADAVPTNAATSKETPVSRSDTAHNVCAGLRATERPSSGRWTAGPLLTKRGA